MDTAFSLESVREYENREDTELHIGIYASDADARAAVQSLKGQPGFCDYPEGFKIFPRQLGITGWQEGFVTKVGPPPKDAAGEAFDLPAWLPNIR
jgi:hypothetical protein